MCIRDSAISESIGLKNIITTHERVEEHKGHYQFVVSRAVAEYNKLVQWSKPLISCLLYTSDAADERSSVDLGGRRIIKKKTNEN